MTPRFRDLLSDAVSGSPPSSIDLDEAVRRGRGRARRRRAAAVVAAAVLGIAVVASGDLARRAGPLLSTQPAHPSPGPAGDTCPHLSREAARTVMIDWPDLVRVDGLTYLGEPQGGTALSPRLIGPQIATVACRMEGNVADAGYRMRDGDAAFLEPGTAIHAVQGYRTTFRLAARTARGWQLYEVDDVASATRGEDLLDLAGKVKVIDLLDGESGTRVLRRVDDPATVDRLVTALLAAPVTRQGYGNEVPVFLRFELTDGTYVQRAWFRASGVIWRGIQAPPTFARALGP